MVHEGASAGLCHVCCALCVCVWKEGSLADAVCLFQGELLSPCRCDGSVKCTHQPCLIKWISERGCWSCELCYYKYHVIAISTKNPLQVKVLETFQSLFILVSIFVSGSNWILPVWVFLPCAQGFICLRCFKGLPGAGPKRPHVLLSGSGSIPRESALSVLGNSYIHLPPVENSTIVL